jgi:hypothetical protein
MARDYSLEELPAHDQLADEDDELGWDREKHGLFADFSTGEDWAPKTVPYNPERDPFLQED